MKKETLQKREVLEALINVLDPKIAMTRSRIRELMLKSNPQLDQNPFANTHKHLSVILIRQLFMTQLEAFTILDLKGERWETSDEDPIMYEDLEISMKDSYRSIISDFISAEIYESGWLRRYKSRYDYERFVDEIRRDMVVDTVVNSGILVERGFSGTQLFFRRLDLTNSRKRDSLPQVPAMIV
jgi:hypothetical protein